MDDLTNQAIDLVLENDALHERVVKPLKQKMFPYAVSITIFNLIPIYSRRSPCSTSIDPSDFSSSV